MVAASSVMLILTKQKVKENKKTKIQKNIKKISA